MFSTCISTVCYDASFNCDTNFDCEVMSQNVHRKKTRRITLDFIVQSHNDFTDDLKSFIKSKL